MKRLAMLLLAVLVLAVPVACKKGAETPIEPTQAPGEVPNPLAGIFEQMLTKRDEAFGKLAQKLEGYSYSGVGADRTALVETVMRPFSDASTELAPLIVNNVYMQDDGSGVRWEVRSAERDGDVVQEQGQLQLDCLSYYEADADGAVREQRQTCEASLDGTRITAKLYNRLPGENEAMNMRFEYELRGNTHYMQIWYSLNFGDGFTLLRVVYDDTSLRYGVFENAVDEPASLYGNTFEEGIFTDALTTVEYAGASVTIVNEERQTIIP
ncbi:hypothetical protein LJC55_01660 [Eubacteriales bacterium OttesenSCG-928-N14]|nr:hypothetical protein [Eubacteriales bacterium OttesenSCG-928-N14]